jgi:hypothetical protein
VAIIGPISGEINIADCTTVPNCTDRRLGVLKPLSSVCESTHSDNDDEVLQYATVVPFPSGKAALTRKAVPMDGMKQVIFDPYKYLASPGIGRRLVRFKAKHVLFSQGSPADAVFYIHSGRAKLTVVSKSGKEATVTLLAAGDFVGEESISEPCRRSYRYGLCSYRLCRPQNR